MRIDDGSNLYSGNCDPSYGGPYGDTGVIVFGDNVPSLATGTYVAVTGPSSVWKPNGSSDTYRSIWIANNVQDMTSAWGGEYSGSGTISGTVTLYEMPTSSADVTLYSTCGRMQTLTVQRGAGNVGTASYEWTDVPRYDPIYNYANYLISAKCDGYKTRTYRLEWPWGSSTITRNLYLTPLRKITLETQGDVYIINPCTSSSLNIIATVRDDNHDPIVYNAQNPPPGSTVRFVTNAGSFNETTLQQTCYAHTDANGQATVTLHGMRWAGAATVVATDDVAANGDLMTPDYPDTTDDAYRCDWEPVRYSNGQPATISIQAPYVGVDVSAEPEYIARCGSSYSTVTAHVTLCTSNAPTGATVNFTIGQNDPCVFVDTGTKSTSANTNAGGDAGVQVKADDDHHIGTATITASASVYAGSGQGVTNVTVAEYAQKVGVYADPTEITGSGYSTVTFTATDPTDQPIQGLQLNIRATAGTLSNMDPSNGITNANGQVSVRVNLSSPPSAYVSAGYADACLGTVNVGTVVMYRESPWNSDIAVDFSSPLVDDLVPGGNTVSAADIAGIGKIVTAPGGWVTEAATIAQVFAFGYDTTTFKPVAGWPTGWPAAGILLDSNPRYTYNYVQSSPVVGDVMNTSTQEVPDQQIVVGTTQGDVFVLWKDGNNHANGPVARVWTCSQGDYVAVNATPAICSLNGSTLSLIVGSNDGIYKMDLYSSALDPYDPSNAARPRSCGRQPDCQRSDQRRGLLYQPVASEHDLPDNRYGRE